MFHFQIYTSCIHKLWYFRALTRNFNWRVATISVVKNWHPSIFDNNRNCLKLTGGIDPLIKLTGGMPLVTPVLMRALRKRYEDIQIVSLLGWINSDSKDFNFEGWCKVDKNKPSRYTNLDWSIFSLKIRNCWFKHELCKRLCLKISESIVETLNWKLPHWIFV